MEDLHFPAKYFILFLNIIQIDIQTFVVYFCFSAVLLLHVHIEIHARVAEWNALPMPSYLVKA
jgi:hypothetical protein